jgi:hypothetical protein
MIGTPEIQARITMSMYSLNNDTGRWWQVCFQEDSANRELPVIPIGFEENAGRFDVQG